MRSVVLFAILLGSRNGDRGVSVVRLEVYPESLPVVVELRILLVFGSSPRAMVSPRTVDSPRVLDRSFDVVTVDDC